MYKRDERGDYKQAARWIEAWGGHPYLPGWAVCELREYEDGTMRVHKGEPQYLHDQKSQELYTLHAIYMQAAQALFNVKDKI